MKNTDMDTRYTECGNVGVGAEFWEKEWLDASTLTEEYNAIFCLQ